jgi:hypothetical protein
MVELAAIIIILIFGVPLALEFLGILGDLMKSIGNLFSGFWRLPPPEKGFQKVDHINTQVLEHQEPTTPDLQIDPEAICAAIDRASLKRDRLNKERAERLEDWQEKAYQKKTID